MTAFSRPLALVVFCLAGIDLWLGLGAVRLGLGLAGALSLVGGFAGLVAARVY